MESVENQVLREGMIAIRWVLRGEMGQKEGTRVTFADRLHFVLKGHLAERLKGRLALAERIADAMHNVSDSTGIGRQASAEGIVDLLRDEPDLSFLLQRSRGWAEQIMLEAEEAKLAEVMKDLDPDTPMF